MSNSKVFAKALIVRGEKVLLLRRSADDSWRPGKLDFAGGAIEAEEDIIEGLLREISEETGLVVGREDAFLAYTHTSMLDDANCNRLYFVAIDSSDREVVLSSEHDRVLWLSLDEAIDQNDHPMQKAFLEYTKENALLALSD